MTILKTPQEIEQIQKSAQIAKVVMERTVGWIHPGLATLQVDKFINSQIKSFHSKPSFFGVGGYKFSSCISVNSEIVHGMPSKRVIRDGDIVSIDLGTQLNGWNSDMCRTVIVGKKKENKFNTEFLKLGETTLSGATKQVVVGNRVGDISSYIQKNIERAGFNVIRDFTGHAIGKELHEDPTIPCFGVPGTGEVLKVGMVLCVEIMYMAGSPLLTTSGNGWTVQTMDGKISAMFEDMVALTKEGPRCLTR